MDDPETFTKEGIMKTIKEEGIEFIRLQFTDIFGFAKNVAITDEKIEDALNGDIMFDGSSIDGFARIEESDMYLVPDLDTFKIIPWKSQKRKIANIICDVYDFSRNRFEGCPRNILDKTLDEAKEMGFELSVGPEGEFFLFHTDEAGNPVFDLHDNAGYFDLSPVDKGERARRDIILKMKQFGFSVEASHHEVAPGQHEIDFKHDEAMRTADKWMMFKEIVRTVADRNGLYASYIPKPFSGENANAMHCNQSLSKDGENIFFDEDENSGISQTARYYIGGLIKHAKGIAAICNPTVNSYKRLVVGHEAPTKITWSCANRSAFIRIPASRGDSTRIELRTPDPTANPYLVFAVMLKAGLDGIRNKIDPPEECTENIYHISEIDSDGNTVPSYPRDLYDALVYMKKDPMIKEVLGKHAFDVFYSSKMDEWEEYSKEVHEWEIKKYLSIH